MTQAPPVTLADFLLARIAEDEDVAQAAGPTSPTRWQIHTTLTTLSHGERVGPRGTVEYAPGRVLAECEAKRRIVEQHAFNAAALRLYRKSEPTMRAVSELDGVLQLLALPYASHPDYRSEWALT